MTQGLYLTQPLLTKERNAKPKESRPHPARGCRTKNHKGGRLELMLPRLSLNECGMINSDLTPLLSEREVYVFYKLPHVVEVVLGVALASEVFGPGTAEQDDGTILAVFDH